MALTDALLGGAGRSRDFASPLPPACGNALQTGNAPMIAPLKAATRAAAPATTAKVSSHDRPR
jgi:hypothetical protein